MITWMQRHKKWLIITIWISTIAFVGAGFVGWGQYNYGDKAGAVAKVGDIEISQGELQKAYSRLYNKYNQAFQGNFDEEKAKQFGLNKQALQGLVQQSLILNLAKSYDLMTTDKEIINILESQKAFYKDGVFNKEIYRQVLSENRLTAKEYESGLKKELLIQKTLSLLPVKVSKNEKAIVSSMLSIADKINYKILTLNDVKINITDDKLKKFWKTMKSNFMSDVVYQVKYIKQTPIHAQYSDKKIKQYYQDNRTHFKAKDAKILPLEKAKDKVIDELNKKETKDQALRAYIAFKKNKLNKNMPITETKLSQSSNEFNANVLEKISKAAMTKPFIKPILVGNDYYIFELTKIIRAKEKTFAEAKADVIPLYVAQMKKQMILKIANNSVTHFSGITTDFITLDTTEKIKGLNKVEATDFLQKLFVTDKKKGFVSLNDGNIVLYNILEQKMLPNTNKKIGDEIAKLKDAMFNEGLIKKLQKMYKTEIFVKGL
ncbi:peptidylprolyl isomerase [Sulfurimonas sp.]